MTVEMIQYEYGEIKKPSLLKPYGGPHPGPFVGYTGMEIWHFNIDQYENIDPYKSTITNKADRERYVLKRTWEKGQSLNIVELIPYFIDWLTKNLPEDFELNLKEQE